METERIKKAKEVLDELVANTPEPNREQFLIHLDAALRICQLPLTVSQVEQAVKIYNTVKEHGGQTSIEHLLR